MAKKAATKRAPRLNPKRTLFVAEYLVDLNATQAAIRAGYSAKTAEVQGCRLLRTAQVAQAVDAAKEKRSAATGITQEKVLKETALLAFSDVTNYVLGDDGRLALAPGAPPDAMRAVSSIKYRTITTGSGKNERTEYVCEFKLWDKPGMVKLAGRHVDTHGFSDRLEITGKNGGPLDVVTKVEVVIVDAAAGGA